MKAIKKSKPYKKIIIIGILVAAVCGLVIGGWLFYSHYHLTASTKTNTTPPTVQAINYGPATQQEKQEGLDQKQQVVDKAATPQPSTSAGSDLSVSIVRASQIDSGQPLNIRTVVNGTTTGSCEVQLTRSGQPTVAESYTIVVSATYATCDQANVPISAFSASGSWNLSIVVKVNSTLSQAATKVVNITK